jgi:hypothetical protein
MLSAEEMVQIETEKWNQLKQSNQPKPPVVSAEQIQNKRREIDERRMYIIHSLLLKCVPSIENFQPKSKNDKYTQLEHFFVLLSENAEAKKLLRELWNKANPANLSNILE